MKTQAEVEEMLSRIEQEQGRTELIMALEWVLDPIHCEECGATEFDVAMFVEGGGRQGAVCC